MNDNRCSCNNARANHGYDHSRMNMCSLSAFPENPVLAMAYVPMQTDLEIYSCKKALACGTLFPALDKPFLAGVCK